MSAAPTLTPLLLDLRGVAHATGLGERTIVRFVAGGRFPRADVSVGARIRRWKMSTVEAWIESHAGGAK